MSSATQSLQPLVDGIRRSWRASPLPAFLHWWAGELRGLLPVHWRGFFSSGADWYLLQAEAATWSLRRNSHAEVLASWHEAEQVDGSGKPPLALRDALQRVDREDLRVALLLSPALVLRRSVSLPLAARDNLFQVAGFELDRQTPFTLAQVYYSVRELPTAAPPGRFNAELVVVTRDHVDPLLARLQTQSVGVDAVDVAAGASRLGVNLLPQERVPRHAHPRRRLNLLLAATCVLLLVFVFGEWLHNRQLALQQMRTEVEAMRGEAQQVAALRQQLQDNAGAAGFLAQRKKNSVAMLSVLEDATARLPDSAWLERFSVDNTGQIGFQGQSQQAAKLLDALKDSHLITDASFQGSIQPDPTTGKERFYLTARVNQPKSPVADAANAGGTP
ncbi:fimbrial assembly protein [Rhodanobacter sp. AS-Z3]|uniref:PilN domain-containing protein n=1 Tax=Rhodanobacter sp. AS-Z3 TaxID=3031330 RepID=UPI002479C0E8|nr:PilN domain-containing protein [Rhodanobacter sp. AS-Z3]WEN15299.1 fimbrial assembly protein [Rhodanobacter sp. AS-Z3]